MGGCNGPIIGEHNIQNFNPRIHADNIARIGNQIPDVLNYTTFVSLQEVQDNNGVIHEADESQPSLSY